MQRRNKFLMIGAGAALLVGLVVRAAVFGGPKIAYDTHRVERGTLRQTVEVTGEVVSSADVDLKFETAGRLRTISKKVGDPVKAGELLASLDDRNEGVRVQSARAALQSAQAGLDRLLKGATPEDVRIAEVAVANAELALEKARQSLADTEVSNAASLERSWAEFDGQVETLFLKASTAMQVLKSDVFDAAGNFRNDFYTTDAGLASRASAAFASARADFSRMESDILLYRSADRTSKEARASAVLAETRTIRTAAQLANELMQTSTPNGLTTQAAFDVRKSNVRGAWIDLNASLNSAELQKTSIVSTLASNASALNAAAQGVRAAEGALESSKASLALKKAPATSYDLSAARASVTQASASLSEAALALERARIRAPYDGVIAAVLGRVGSTVTSNDVILKLQGDGIYEIEADVPETDVAKLRAGMDAEMTLDAYGDDAVFTGKLSSIDSAQTVIKDVVYYKTRFLLDAGGREVRAGMTASVTVIALERTDALVVPQRSVREDENGNKYVRILENGAETRRDVTVGVRGDEGRVEILSGLSGGEEVILAVTENGEIKR